MLHKPEPVDEIEPKLHEFYAVSEPWRFAEPPIVFADYPSLREALWGDHHDAEAVVLRVKPGTSEATDITSVMAWEWAYEHGDYDRPPAIFERFIGEEMQTRRDAAEDPTGLHDRGCQQYHEGL